MYLHICAPYADQSSCSDKLLLKHNLPIWECLHGFWRTLPNYNPYTVSSDPSQDIEGEAQELLFPSRGNRIADQEEEPENELLGDEIEDASLVDLVEGAAGLVDVDIDIGLEGFDDAPEVRNHTC